MNQSSIHTIISLTGEMIRVYPTLRQIILDAPSKNNPAKYIAFMSASKRGRWFSDNYLSRRRFSGLKNAVSSYAIGKECGSLVTNMFKEVNAAMETTGNKNFQSLENMLPTFLAELAKIEPSHAETLIYQSGRLNYEIDLTAAQLKAFMKSHDIEKIVESEQKVIDKKRGKLIGEQNAAVEAIISNLLSTLDGAKADTIRRQLARSDNKLQMLQQLMTA